MLESGQSLIDNNFQGEFFRCLPDEDRPITLSQALVNVSKLKSESGFDMCSGNFQRKVGVVEEMLNNMTRSISPEASILSGGDFYTQTLNRLATFVRHTDEAGNLLCGKAALDVLFELVVPRMNKTPPEATLNDLEVFQTHKWLLSQEQTKQLSKWVVAVLKVPSGGGQASGASSSSSSTQLVAKPTKKQIKLEQKVASGRAAVMKYF